MATKQEKPASSQPETDTNSNEATPIEAAAKAKSQDETPAIKLVKMIRDEAGTAGPKTADVHPAEVENWQRHGWRVSK